jgi:hypothetical protein
MPKRNPRAFALVTAVVSVALFAPAAQATPPTTYPPEIHNDYYDFTCDAGTPADPSDDFTAQEHHTGEGALTLKSRRSAPQGVDFGTFRGYDDGTYTATWPNGTSVIWSSRDDFIEKDRRIVSIDGDMATVLVGTTFHSDLFAPDGTLDNSNVGMFQFTVKVNLTTGEGDFYEVVRDVGHRGARGTLCGDAMRFAGLN